MRDNAAVKANIAITPTMKMATNHKYSAPSSISICQSLWGDGSKCNRQVSRFRRSVVEHDIEQRGVDR